MAQMDQRSKNPLNKGRYYPQGGRTHNFISRSPQFNSVQSVHSPNKFSRSFITNKYEQPRTQSNRHIFDTSP